MGKIKYKGCYAFEGLGWHQNHSALVVKKAACAALLEGKNVREFIMNHDDIFDFFLCAKVGRNDSLVLQAPAMWGDSIVIPKRTVEVLQNITRYYISNTGAKLTKVMKPLKRKTSNIDMVYTGWISKKISGVNKNLKITNEHEFNSAIKAGYRIKDGGTFTHTYKREIGIDKDWLVTPINNITDETVYDINYEYYIVEAEKLVNKIL